MASLRERILVSDAGSQLFAGTFQQAVDPLGTHTREQAEEALRTAAAEDVFEGLPEGTPERDLLQDGSGTPTIYTSFLQDGSGTLLLPFSLPQSIHIVSKILNT